MDQAEFNVIGSSDCCNSMHLPKKYDFQRSSTPQNLEETCSSKQFDLNPCCSSDMNCLDVISHIPTSNAINANDKFSETNTNTEALNISQCIENHSLIHKKLPDECEISYNNDENKTLYVSTPYRMESKKRVNCQSLLSNCHSDGNQEDSKNCEDIKYENVTDSYCCEPINDSHCCEPINDICKNSSDYYHLVMQGTVSLDLKNNFQSCPSVSEKLHSHNPVCQLMKTSCQDINTDTEKLNQNKETYSQEKLSENKKNYWWEVPKPWDSSESGDCEKSNQIDHDIPPQWWNSSEQSIASEKAMVNETSQNLGIINLDDETNKTHWVSVSDRSYETKTETEQEPSEFSETTHDSRLEISINSESDINQQNNSVRPKDLAYSPEKAPSQDESEGYSTMSKSHETFKNTQLMNKSKYNASDHSETLDNSQDISFNLSLVKNYSQEVSNFQGNTVPSRLPYHFQDPASVYEKFHHKQTDVPSNIFDQHLQTRIHSETERMRHRSGSWTGANESDDDVEHVTGGNRNSTNLSQTSDDSSELRVVASHGLQNSYESSYHNGYDSCRSAAEEMVPHYDQFIDEEKIKKKLKFFFMNPLEKFQASRRFPWKMLVQIIKILICTIQLGMFASQRYSHVTYLWDTKVSLSHLFIKSWDSTREVVAYPPSTGPLAVYTLKEYYGFIDFSIKSFSEIETTAIGAYKYQRSKTDEVVMPEFCITKYKNGFSNFHNHTFSLDNSILTECFPIPSSALNNTGNFSIQQFLDFKNRSINFDLLLESSFSFNLETMKLRSDFPYETPECYRLETSIYFDNNDHDGQVLIDLDIGAKVLDCEGNLTDSTSADSGVNPLRTSLNISTISVCVISLILCLRALFRAQILKSAVNSCFRYRFLRELDRWESFEFVNLWYVLICINDVLIIVGSVIKMSLEGQDYEGYLDKWNVCSLLLGTGNLFIWFGCLRYFGFFETYNVLILTMKHCIPNVCRYSICTLMVFAGYSLCGWLVLGPYHIKFRSLSTTFECLFSLINGDDMFATFSSTIGKDFIVWWFSRIYIYSFTSLFIYVILSLAIAIITDTYYTVQTWYKVGYPETELRKYASSSKATAANGDFQDTSRSFREIVAPLFCCCCCSQRCRERSTGDYEPIPSNAP